jgi:hypothetical protein
MGNIVCECAAVFVAKPAVLVKTPCMISGDAERISHAGFVTTEAVIPLYHTVGYRGLSYSDLYDNQESHQEKDRDH